MIKISISGTATDTEKEALTVALEEAVKNYLAQFPTAKAKLGFRRPRSVVAVNNLPNTTEVVTGVGSTMTEAHEATETPAEDVE